MRISLRAHGFTLVELIVTIAIAAILMSIAVPSYQYITTANRISGEINGLLGDMQYARSEAIKEGQTVTVCPSNAAGTACVATNTWSNGWIVFADANNNQTVDAGEAVLRVRPSFATTNSVDTLTSNAANSVTFNREGFAFSLLGISGVSTAIFSAHNTPTVANYTRCLELSNTGFLTTVVNGVSGCS